MTKYPRTQKLIEPRLKLKFALVFMTTAAAVVLAQTIGLFHTLHSFAVELPNDGPMVQMQVPAVLLKSTLLTLGLVVPLSLFVGVLTMFRIVGPLYRFRVFLRQVAAGENPGPCKIRKGDELHDFCDLLNEVTAPLRQGSAAEKEDEPPAPPPEAEEEPESSKPQLETVAADATD